MIYQHPLAYLVGLEGLALLQRWAGDHDKEFVLARLAEVRRMVNDPELARHPGVEVARGEVVSGYRRWSSTYDDEPNGLFAIDEPIVDEILDSLRPGPAVDAACGTGRLTTHLVTRGHAVIGVDSSPDMLEKARERVPEGDFRVGDLRDLPVEDVAVDLVVCGLALSHVPSLEPVMNEFARVLRPGGSLVISDCHHELILRGSVAKAPGPHGGPGLVPAYRHTTGDVLRAALEAGLEARRCEEPIMPPTDARVSATEATDISIGEWTDWPWSMLGCIPEASRAAWSIPPIVVWHFQRGRHR